MSESAAERFDRDHGSEPIDRQTDEYLDEPAERQSREYVDSNNVSAEDNQSPSFS